MKRLAIYATYHPKGFVDDYILYMIEKLRKVTDDIYIVSNHTYTEGQKEKLKGVSRVYERDDTGFDVGGFAYVMKSIEEENRFGDYDELILLNDSIFGPFYSLNDMFHEMETRNAELDFWAITRRGRSDFDGGDSTYPEHLQIYFYVIRKRMFHSKEFFNYWKKIVELVTDFRSAILNYEFEFTNYFESLGYKWDSYCRCSEYVTAYPHFNLSPYHYGMYKLIKEEKCPFLKRKLFTGDFVNKKYSDTQDLKNAVKYIDKFTDYNIDMIWRHIIDGYQIADVMKAAHLIEIVDKFENDIPYTEDNHSGIEICDKFGTFESLRIKSCPSSEYIMYLDLEKDIQPAALWNSYYCNLYQNICYGENYINSLLELFEKDKWLGAIVPPFNTYGKISKSIAYKWMDSGVFENIRNKYILSVPSSCGQAAIYSIKGFICKKNILPEGFIEDLNEDMTGTVLQMVPLFAQQKGYYTKIVINENYCASYFDNMFSITSTMWDTFASCSEMDLDMDGIKDNLYKVQIKSFVENMRRVYVYGAGALGHRIVRIIENDVDILGILVSDIHGNPDKVNGYAVQSIDCLHEKNPGIIVAVGKKNNPKISKLLEKKGYTNYILVD